MEKMYKKHFLLSSYLFTISSVIFTTGWAVALIIKIIGKGSSPSSTRRMGWTPELIFLVPILVGLAGIAVSIVPKLRARWFVRSHSALLAACAVSYAVAECTINALIGRPAAPFWVMAATATPVVLQARAVPALVFFHSLHSATAFILFFVVAPMDRDSVSNRGQFLPRTWRLYLNTVFSGALAIALSTLACDQLDRMQRRLFLLRWEAIKGVKDLEASRERGKVLSRNILPEIYADKVFSSDVVFAEVSDLVGVLAIRFAPSQPTDACDFQSLAASLEETRAIVSSLDLLLKRLGGGALEKVSVHDGMYIAASNVAVPGTGPLAEMDPGQRFLNLLMLSVASTTTLSCKAVAGVHIGRCASGVLGSGRLSYDIFGEAAHTAQALCESCKIPGMILCSSAARAMIPRHSAKWGDDTVSINVPGIPAPVMALKLIGLHQRRMPEFGEPILPHSVPAETVPLVSPLPIEIEPPGAEGSSPLRTTLDYTAKTGPIPAELSLTPLATTTRSLPTGLTDQGLRLTTQDLQEAGRDSAVDAWTWSLTFRDPLVEARYRTWLAENSRHLFLWALGAAFFSSALVKELALPDGVRPASAVMTALPTVIFAASGILAWRRKLSHRQASLMLVAGLVIGAAGLMIALLTPWRSPWVEIRFASHTNFMALAFLSPVPIGLSVALIAAQGAVLMVYFFTHKSSAYFILINRPTFPVIVIFIAFGLVAVRYMHELNTRKAFLLYTRSAQLLANIDREVSRGLRSIGSFVPPSITAQFLEGMVINKDLSLGIRGMPDIYLRDWPLLCCHIHNLSPRFIAGLTPQNLMRILREFFLLAETSAAAEDCEVIRTGGGKVMISPRLDMRDTPDTRKRLESIVRVGEAILKNASALNDRVKRLLHEPLDRDTPWAVEICAAVATGPCIGGMVGTSKSIFKLLGPAPFKTLHLLSVAKPGQLLIEMNK